MKDSEFNVQPHIYVWHRCTVWQSDCHQWVGYQLIPATDYPHYANVLKGNSCITALHCIHKSVACVAHTHLDLLLHLIFKNLYCQFCEKGHYVACAKFSLGLAFLWNKNHFKAQFFMHLNIKMQHFDCGTNRDKCHHFTLYHSRLNKDKELHKYFFNVWMQRYFFTPPTYYLHSIPSSHSIGSPRGHLGFSLYPWLVERTHPSSTRMQILNRKIDSKW